MDDMPLACRDNARVPVSAWETAVLAAKGVALDICVA